jgi:hypothetical protein
MYAYICHAGDYVNHLLIIFSGTVAPAPILSYLLLDFKRRISRKRCIVSFAYYDVLCFQRDYRELTRMFFFSLLYSRSLLIVLSPIPSPWPSFPFIPAPHFV